MKIILRIILCFFILSLPAGAEDLNEQLFEAVRAGDLTKVQQLLDRGADVNARSKYGATPLFFACDRGHLEIVKLLIDRGADVNVVDTFYNSRPVEWAYSNKHLDVVKLLLQKGANPDVILISVAEEGNAELVKLILVNSRPSAEALTKALAHANEKKDAKLTQMLQDAGAALPEVSKAIDPATLQIYAGKFRSDDGNVLTLTPKENGLQVQSADGLLTLIPSSDQHTFQVLEISGFTAQFQVADGRTEQLRVSRPDGTSTVYLRWEEPAPEVVRTPPKRTERPLIGKVTKPANWPSFRGDKASGVADGQNPPIEWDGESGKNIAWKTAIPGLSHSSPVVWEDKIFVTSAISSDPESSLKHGLYGDVAPALDLSEHSWRIYSLDKKTGKILWERVVHEGKPNVKRHPKSTQANSTPATDGKHVVALFGFGGLYCYDLKGNLLWKRDLGVLDSGWFYDPDYQWGYGSSPVIYKDLVIVQVDLQKNSYIAAFNTKNGEPVWKTDRDEIPSWGTPTVVETPVGVQVVTNGTKFVRGYDATTGKELWRLSGNSEITAPTPIAAHDLIYVTSGYPPIRPIYAIRFNARGDISLLKGTEANDHVAWSKNRGGPYIPTPIVYGDYLYTCGINGVVTAYNAKTGERIYQQRLGGQGSAYAFTASPVAADGRLYFASEDGEVYVIKAGPEYEVLAANKMSEVILATPAISDGMLFIRGVRHLYGIKAN